MYEVTRGSSLDTESQILEARAWAPCHWSG